MTWSWYRGCHKGFARLNLDIDNWLSSIKSSILVSTADLYPAINDEIDFFCRWKDGFVKRYTFDRFVIGCKFGRCRYAQPAQLQRGPCVSTLKPKSPRLPPSSC